MKKTQYSRRKKRINKMHSSADINQFVSLLQNLIDHRGDFDPQLLEKSESQLTRTDFDILALAVTDFLIARIVEDYVDLEHAGELYLVSAWTARVEFRFDHSKRDRLPIRQNWVSGMTLHRAWEFAQLSESERLQSGYRCKTLLLDMLLLLHGWEGYAGFLNGWRLSDDKPCLPLPEGFK